jgi:proteasome activator subunit 4
VKKVTWEPKVQPNHRLTDDDITHFVEAIQPVAIQAMYSKTGALDMVQVLQNLATLRPNLVVPPVIEKLV